MDKEFENVVIHIDKGNEEQRLQAVKQLEAMGYVSDKRWNESGGGETYLRKGICVAVAGLDDGTYGFYNHPCEGFKEIKLQMPQHNDEGWLCLGLNQSAETIHKNNKEKGFWDTERNVGELLMLVTSELGEAMEAHRKGGFAIKNLPYKGTFKDWFEKRYKDTFEDEIADAIIRLLDLCAGLGIDIEEHINQKVKYNKLRERLHGKKY